MWTLLLAVAAHAIAPAEVPDPRAHGGWVVDLAEVLDPQTVSRLDARLDALHRDLTVEVGVVVVQETELTPKQFTTELFNHWGVGDPLANNGLLVVLVMDARRVEMETGYGLEPILPDAWLGRMQADAMVPRFRVGDFGGGLEAGIEATEARLREHALEARVGTRIQEYPSEPWPDAPTWRSGSSLDASEAALVTYGGAASLLALGGLLYVRRRRRTCPECQVYMPMLDEVADDVHLEAGQRREEALGSVDYRVHTCPTCEHVRTFRRVRWLSGYSRCPECAHRARTTARRTLQSATYDRSGTAEVTETCHHCAYRNSYTVTIPRKQRPSSSSSSSSSRSSWGSSSSSRSSGGSFGGGRSGGGGAGSSW